jgi:hypothetical protein
MTRHNGAFIAAVGLLFLGCAAGGQTVPAAVSTAAQAGLRAFLDRIPAGQRAEYGFAETDSLDQAELGDPWQLHALTPTALATCKGTTPVSAVISPTKLWYFPVLIASQPKALLVVDHTEAGWEAVSLGYARIAQDLALVREQWSTAKGHAPLFVASFQARQHFFTVPTVDAFNLTPLLPAEAGAGGTPKGAARYAALDTLASVAKRLQPTVESNLRQGAP